MAGTVGRRILRELPELLQAGGECACGDVENRVGELVHHSLRSSRKISFFGKLFWREARFASHLAAWRAGGRAAAVQAGKGREEGPELGGRGSRRDIDSIRRTMARLLGLLLPGFALGFSPRGRSVAPRTGTALAMEICPEISTEPRRPMHEVVRGDGGAAKYRRCHVLLCSQLRHGVRPILGV